jgi:hypothetical protein
MRNVLRAGAPHADMDVISTQAKTVITLAVFIIFPFF